MNVILEVKSPHKKNVTLTLRHYSSFQLLLNFWTPASDVNLSYILVFSVGLSSQSEGLSLDSQIDSFKLVF